MEKIPNSKTNAANVVTLLLLGWLGFEIFLMDYNGEKSLFELLLSVSTWNLIKTPFIFLGLTLLVVQSNRKLMLNEITNPVQHLQTFGKYTFGILVVAVVLYFHIHEIPHELRSPNIKDEIVFLQIIPILMIQLGSAVVRLHHNMYGIRAILKIEEENENEIILDQQQKVKRRYETISYLIIFAFFPLHELGKHIYFSHSIHYSYLFGARMQVLSLTPLEFVIQTMYILVVVLILGISFVQFFDIIILTIFKEESDVKFQLTDNLWHLAVLFLFLISGFDNANLDNSGVGFGYVYEMGDGFEAFRFFIAAIIMIGFMYVGLSLRPKLSGEGTMKQPT